MTQYTESGTCAIRWEADQFDNIRLTNSKGHTFTAKSEDLHDFISYDGDDGATDKQSLLDDFAKAAYKSTMDLKRLVAKYDGLSRRFKELEAENTRYRDRIGEALKFLLSRQQTTPGLGAPVTILKQALEK